jgi:hypothetical protein
MFNVYTNQQSRQTGSRNLMGPKTLPTIWDTYMTLVTKYQISVINSCWEKCDEKCTYMFNVYKDQLSRQTGSRNLTGCNNNFKYTSAPRRGRGYTVLPLSVCPSFRPSKIFFVPFFSVTVDGRNLIFFFFIYFFFSQPFFLMSATHTFELCYFWFE